MTRLARHDIPYWALLGMTLGAAPGCLSSDDDGFGGVRDDDASADDDSTPVADDDSAAADDDAVAGPTDGSLPTAFHLDAEGEGDARVGALFVADNTGSLTLDGVKHLGFAYQHHDWQETGYVLYDVLSLAEDGSNLAMSYLYCDGVSLPYVYTESYFHFMDWEYASGICDGEFTPSTAEVSLPALRAFPPSYTPGITIDGEGLSLDGDQGSLDLAGEAYSLYPFASVDCSACPGGPWLELHSVLAAAGEACFGILYLFPDDPTSAILSYTICLPSLDMPAGDGIVYDVQWQGSLGAARRAVMPWRPLPPGR